MGKKYVIDEMTLTNIADAIREVEQDSMTKVDPVDMPGRIGDVCNKAYNDGKSDGGTEGYNKGHTDGYNEGHTAGKQEEYDAFWDAYQDYGKRTNYKNAFFGYGWGAATFKPKYSIQPTTAHAMFQESAYQFRPWNMVAILEECGVSIDFSKVTGGGFNYTFYATLSTTIPFVDTTAANDTSLGYTFSSQYIKKIYGIKLKDTGKQTFPSTFYNAISLTDITITGGVIGQNISFAQSPLTVESMLSIITHLKNCSGTSDAGKYTLTLKDTCKTLMAEQGAIEELGGKTYDQYITDIGWNLA